MKTKSETKASEKRLLLFRHGHRSVEKGRERDNGLSKKGRKQSRDAARCIAALLADTRPLLRSSPAKRCVETLQPLAKVLKSKIKTDSLLDEANSAENLNRKVSKFCSQWRNSREKVVVLCSHGDWIPECIRLLTGTSIELAKGGWAELRQVNSNVELRWIVQDARIIKTK